MIHILGGNHALHDLGNIYQTAVNQFTQMIDSAGGGYDVTVDMSQHDPDSSEMPAWRIDGAIILARCTEPTMQDLTRMQIPYVVVNGDCPDGGFSVVPDDIAGTWTAMNYLRTLGHTKIAYGGPLPTYLADHSSLRHRHDTYLAAMENFGHEPILTSIGTLESSENYLREVVFGYEATAILAYGHMEALNLLQAAHTLGITVPQELSLICFCDQNASRIMSPGLTFIDLNSERLGTVTAELLMQQIRHPDQATPQQVLLPELLMIRNTTAPPRNR
jgi:DNA-binding LacI/PurR family transcriptional regulator